MHKRLILAAFAVLVFTSLMINCDQSLVDSNSGLSDISSVLFSVDTLPPNPLGDRDNPLIAFARDNWTEGDQTSAAGLHYGHIKTYGLAMVDMAWYSNGDEQAEFIADHFDMFAWGGVKVAQRYAALYGAPDPYFCPYIWLNISAPGCESINPGWIQSEVESWVESDMNENGYTWHDLVMHYKYDVSDLDIMLYDDFPGWNPDDDLDGIPDEFGNLCRDIGPTDPTRTAECISDSELRRYDSRWFSRIMEYPFLDMQSDLLTKYYQNWCPFNGCWLDEVAVNVAYDLGMQSTFAYSDLNLSNEDANYVWMMDKYYMVPRLVEELEPKIGNPLTVYMANIGTWMYGCGDNKEYALEYLENIYDEHWISFDALWVASWFKPTTTNDISCFMDGVYLDYLEGGKGYVCACWDASNFGQGSAQGKKFTLATFYLINHQLAFYSYRCGNNAGHNPSEEHPVWEGLWNPMVEFDVGQPWFNPFGYPDFQGNSRSKLYFVYEDGDGYTIFSRSYKRDDGKMVLILSKIMDYGETEKANPTMVDLQGSYQVVNSDGSLSQNPVQAIQMTNNDGAVLLEYKQKGKKN